MSLLLTNQTVRAQSDATDGSLRSASLGRNAPIVANSTVARADVLVLSTPPQAMAPGTAGPTKLELPAPASVDAKGAPSNPRPVSSSQDQVKAVYAAQGRAFEAMRATTYGVHEGPPPPTAAETQALRVSQQKAVVQAIKRFDLDGNGSISVNELLQLDDDPSRFRDVPLDIMLRAERSVMAVSPQLRARRERIARSLLRTAGTGTEADIAAFLPELEKLPLRLLASMKSAGLSVVVCRNAVTDYLPAWADKRARGHDANDNWQELAGGVNGKEIVVATKDDATGPFGRGIPRIGQGHGSYSVLLHEIGHAVNIYRGDMVVTRQSNMSKNAKADECAALKSSGVTVSPRSSSPGYLNYEPGAVSSWSRSFLDARRADWNRLLPYYRQDGEEAGSGADEAFAESFARFYGDDSLLAWNWPKLTQFWASNPMADRSIRDAAAAIANGCGTGIRARESRPRTDTPPTVDALSTNGANNPSVDVGDVAPAPVSDTRSTATGAATPAPAGSVPAPISSVSPDRRYRAPWEHARLSA